MAKISTQRNARIPSWAMSYLINNDSSGITEEEKNQCDKFIGEYLDWCDDATLENKKAHNLVIVPLGESEFFSHYPEFGLAGMVMECDINIMEEE